MIPLIALFDTGVEAVVDVGAMLNSQPCFEGNGGYEPGERFKDREGRRAN